MSTYYPPIDAEFHADFKNVYFSMPILRLSRVIMGVGAIFNWGGDGILGAHRGPKTAENGPHEGAPNNHNLACLYRTILVGITLSYFLVFIR